VLDLLAHHDGAFDMLRVVLLLEGGVVLGLSLFVFRLYMYMRKLTARHGKPQAGAPPYHVALIALSHGLLIVTQMAIIIARVGDEIIWYGSPVAIVAFTFSIIALVNILQLENSRISALLKPLP
jgi:hypothetical protein